MSGKVLLYVAALALAAGILNIGAKQPDPVREAVRLEATNAAFRDGFYLGGLNAREGREPHPSFGRWSRANDRRAFLAGYQRGYQDLRGQSRVN